MSGGGAGTVADETAARAARAAAAVDPAALQADLIDLLAIPSITGDEVVACARVLAAWVVRELAPA